MKRLLLAAGVLCPVMAWGQAIPIACSSPSAKKLMAQDINEILQQSGEGFYHYAVPPLQIGPYNCHVGFVNADGWPMNGIFSLRRNLVGQYIASYQDLTQGP